MKTSKKIFDGKPDVVDPIAESKAIASCLIMGLCFAGAIGISWLIFHLTNNWIMTALIIIYIIGFVINLLMASSIYSDLKDEGQLKPLHVVLLIVGILASFVTWVVVIITLIVQFFRNLKK